MIGVEHWGFEPRTSYMLDGYIAYCCKQHNHHQLGDCIIIISYGKNKFSLQECDITPEKSNILNIEDFIFD